MSDANFMEKLLDGVEVEWKALGEIATLRRGRVMSKGYLADNAVKMRMLMVYYVSTFQSQWSYLM